MDRAVGLLSAMSIACLLAAGPAARAESPDPDHAGLGINSFAGTEGVWLKGSKVQRVQAAHANGSVGQRQIQNRGASGGSTVPLPDMRVITARLCAAGALCDGRQPGGLNPLFPEIAEPGQAAGSATGPAQEAQARVVTINDLARFLPAAIELHAEPDGWAVVGVPANFWTYVRPLTVEGELLGEPAAVRFTPRLYEWNYGDGASRVTQSGGSSWAGAGQEELTETSTSHVYAEKRSAQASVTVYWSAEYRFAGGDWIPVEGAVSNRSPEQRMLVVKERTVLTAH